MIPRQIRDITPLDMVWNAYGYQRSFNFDEKGNWTGRG